MATRLCCSAQDIIDAELAHMPRPKAVANALTDRKDTNLNEIFLAALRSESPIIEQDPIRQSQLRKISRRFSKDSAALKLAAARHRIQRSSQKRLTDRSLEADILLDTTPSLGGYDNDASLLDDGNLSDLALRVPSGDSSLNGLGATAPTNNPENDDDVFSPRCISSPGAPRLPSIASGSISIKWPLPYSSRPCPDSQSSGITLKDLVPEETCTIAGYQHEARSEQCIIHDSSDHVEQHLRSLSSQKSSANDKKDGLEEASASRCPSASLIQETSTKNGSQESLHLYTMRISQHLRSLSNLSSSSGILPSEHGTLVGGASAINSTTFQSMDSQLAESHTTTIPAVVLAGFGHQVSGPLSGDASVKGALDKNSNKTFLNPEAKVIAEDGGQVKLFDGPNDHQLSSQDEARTQQISRPRQRSVDDDYQEAAALWSQALNEYADEVPEQKPYHTSSPRWDWTVPAISSRTSRRYSMIPLRKHERNQHKLRAASAAEMKPSRSQSSQDRRSTESDAHSTAAGRALIVSPDEQPKLHRVPSLAISFDETPSPMLPRKTPIITVTDTDTVDKQAAKISSRQRSGSSLAAWSKYPSHSRHLRSFSAGMLDNVFTRDFADFTAAADDDDDASDHNQNPSHKKSKSKLSRSGLKKRFLSDIPKLFRSHLASSHRTLRGHRTSIAAAQGSVEFPELELIPGGEAAGMPPATPLRKTNQLFYTGSPQSRRRSTMHDPLATPTDSEQMQRRAKLRLGSSSYGSMSDHLVGSKGGASTFSDGAAEQATEWKDFYRDIIAPVHNTDDASMANSPGIVKRVHVKSDDSTAQLLVCASATRNVSAGAKSLPPTFALSRRSSDLDEGNAEPRRIRKSMSAQPMRRSTQDLLTRLDREEAAEMARALRTADEVWSN